MKTYTKEVKSKAGELFDRSFNCINFELIKQAIGEESIQECIINPSEKIMAKEWFNTLTVEEEEKLKAEFNDFLASDPQAEGYNEDETGFMDYLTENYQNEITDCWDENGHYPMWNTLFEAKEGWLSEKLKENADKLYKFGIGVLATDYTNTCLFISGAGYDFYSAHWILLFEWLGWIDVKKIDKEKEAEGKGTANDFKRKLTELAENTTETISRHAKGLLKALKL